MAKVTRSSKIDLDEEYVMKKMGLYFLLASAILLVGGLIFFAVRQAQASSEAEAEWQTIPTIIPPLATTTHLEIIPLYEEASTGDQWISGHGVSYLIRSDAATILFDVGDNPGQSAVTPFAQNLQKYGVDWDEVDRIVISHPHSDHTGGVGAWNRQTIGFGDLPGGVGDRLVFVPTKMNYPGAVHATIPTLPAPDIATTGVIAYPDVFPISLVEPKGNEQALVVNVAGQGLVVITGCGHPGLEKLVTRAEALYKQPVIGVVGGLHYGDATAQEIAPHIQFLQTRQPKLVALSPHDSGSQALEAFRAAFVDHYRALRVGERIQFP